MRSQKLRGRNRVSLSLHSTVVNISLSRDRSEFGPRRDFRAHLAASSSKASEPTGLAHFFGFDLANQSREHARAAEVANDAARIVTRDDWQSGDIVLQHFYH